MSSEFIFSFKIYLLCKRKQYLILILLKFWILGRKLLVKYINTNYAFHEITIIKKSLCISNLLWYFTSYFSVIISTEKKILTLFYNFHMNNNIFNTLLVFVIFRLSFFLHLKNSSQMFANHNKVKHKQYH